MQHSHRSTQKQSNKPFKSRHSSKSQIKAQNKGKVNRNSIKQHQVTKQQKRSQLKNLQQQKRLSLLENRRLFNGPFAAPKQTVLIPLCADIDMQIIMDAIFNAHKEEFNFVNGQAILPITKFKQRISFIPNHERNILRILDTIMIADKVIFVLSAKDEVDEFGELIMSTIKAQAVPDAILMVQHLEDEEPKKHQDIKKSLLYYMSHHFAQDLKIYSVGSAPELEQMTRQITSQVPKPIAWRDRHAYLTAETFEFHPSADDKEVGTLSVTGYVRGSCLSADRLVHIPDYGDFQIGRILDSTISHDETMGDVVLAVPDPDKQDDLMEANEIDPMDAEQTWPTEEELAEAELRTKKVAQKRRVPKGTSSYQAAWILEDDENGEVVSDDSDGEDMVPEPAENSDHESEKEEYEEIDMDNRSILFDELDDEENAKQLKEYLEREREAREAQEFPDEIDTPQFLPASQRFARYRGLKSFRTSPWDPYENLPVDYAKIFQFQNFKRSKKKVLDAALDGIMPGQRVTIELINVPSSIANRNPDEIFVIYGLFEYEHKMTVMNFTVHRTPNYTEPIKSKDSMIIMSGFRRYVVNPVYSRYSRGGPNNVHKCERFLQPGATALATVYAPIQFGSCPVLMFKNDPSEWTKDSMAPLVATGTMLDPQPLRIIAKRIILTGHPYKIHKRGAVIRFMFFSPEDVDYFKPIQLFTKFGRTGHIKESLGTHGYMKCQFDGPIKAHDTVCMSLYKRVFPKWTTKLYSRYDTTDMEVI